MPFLEWQHSDYPQKNSCQSCHMPQVEESAPIAAVLGEPRQGMRQHTFVGANFFILSVLNSYRNDLSVTAMPAELTAEAERTREFLQTQAARVVIRNIEVGSGNLKVDVFVQNLSAGVGAQGRIVPARVLEADLEPMAHDPVGREKVSGEGIVASSSSLGRRELGQEGEQEQRGEVFHDSTPFLCGTFV